MSIITNIDNLSLKDKGSYKDVDEAIANLQDADLAPKKYVDEAVASEISIVNVLDFGADNNGVNDSSIGVQSALDFAETNGIRRVYVPTGEYLLRSTVYIPTEIEFFGDGVEKTIFKIDNQTVLDVVQIFDDSSHYQNFYIPLFATNKQRLSDANNNLLLRDFKIDDMYYIDNDALGQVCPMLIIRTNNSRLENIHFGSVQTEKEQDGITISSLGCSVIFSENITLYKCIHLFAGYESLSIRFLSKNIITESNVFDIDKPSNLQDQVHAAQTARPTALKEHLLDEYGREIISGYKSINDIYYLRNNVSTAFTSHASEGLSIKGAHVEVYTTEESTVFKIYGFSKNSIISKKGSFAMLSTTNANSYAPASNCIVSNNIININGYDSDDFITGDSRSLIGNVIMDYNNTVISGNIINIENYSDGYFSLIGARGNNISISDNMSDGRCSYGIAVGEENEINNLYLDGNIIKGANKRKIQVPLSRKGAVKIGGYLSSIDLIEPVNDLKALNYTLTDISIEWSIPINNRLVESIEVFVDGVLIESLSGLNESYTITNLDSDKVYAINIILVYDNNDKVISNLIYQTTDVEPFITTWKTDNSGTTNDTTIRIPTSGAVYNYDVDWGDGSGWKLGYTGDAEYDYGIAGTYTIKIRGNFPTILMYQSGEEEKILSIVQWGSIKWGTLSNSFNGCVNLSGYNITDVPNLGNVTNMNGVFTNASSFNSNLSAWDVSEVTNMANMFNNASSFNSDLSGWDVSNVTNMANMFRIASSFNSDLSGWDVSNVTSIIDYLRDAELSVDNYSNTLIGWANNPNGLQPNLSFHGGSSKYNAQGAIARQKIIDDYGWTIVDGGPE